MTRPPTVFYLEPGALMTDEQHQKMLAHALRVHYYEQFSKMDPEEAKAESMEMAGEMLQVAQQCGNQHLVRDVSNNIQLQPPSPEECQNMEVILKEILEIKRRSPAPFKKRLSKAAKLKLGKAWYAILKTLGLPTETENWAPDNAVTGPRG